MDNDSPPPIRGRHAELHIADEHLAAIARGDSDVLVVQGSDGAGVTRLLAAARQRAGELGLAVRAAAAVPGDQMLPLGLLVAALDDGALGPRPPGHRATPSAEQARHELLRAIEQHLRALSHTQRVLVCLDDVQLSDPSTLTGLRILAAELADRPIGWLLGVCGREWPPELKATVAALVARGAGRLRLRPLKARAVGQIVHDRLGRPPGPELQPLLDAAAGNAALLVALLDGLEEEGLVRVGDLRVDLLRSAIPARVRDIARDRLEPLSPKARDVVRAAAVLGRTCTYARLSAMLEVGAGALLQPLDELARRGVLAGVEDRILFVEELLGEAIVATLPAPLRVAVQRQAAEVLTTEAGRTLEIATHLVTDGNAGRAGTGATLVAATRRLGDAHPRVAAEIGGQALNTMTDADPAYGTLAAETAVLLHAAGEHERGAALAATALHDPASADAEGELRLQLARAFALPSQVRAESAKRALARAGLSPDLEARLRASLVISLAASGETDEATLVGAAVLEDDRDAKRAGRSRGADAARRSHALAVLAHVQGRYETTFAELNEAEARAEGHPDEEFEALRDLTRSEVGSMTHGPEWALAIASWRSRWARHEQRSVALRLWHGVRGRQLEQAGRLQDAVELLRPLFATSGDGDPGTCWDAAALVAFGRVAAHLALPGDVAVARTRARQALEDTSAEIRRHARWLLACTGDRPATVAEAPRCPADVADPARFVRLYRAIDPAGARAAVALARTRRDQNPDSVLLSAAAQHAAALLADDAQALGQAAGRLDAAGRPLDAAAALGDRAALLRTDAALRAACRAWEDVGAVADAARLRSELS